MASARERVRIPVSHKVVTILLDFAHEQELEKPDMLDILPIKLVIPFKSGKEAPPQAYEVTTRLHPESLNTGVRC